MRKKRNFLPLLLMTGTTVAACAVHLYQLLRQTSSLSGLMYERTASIYVLYALLLVTVAAAVMYALNRQKEQRALYLQDSHRAFAVTSALAAAGFLYDFVHQSFNCYRYADDAGYLEYAYLIPTALSGLLSLLSASFFVAFFLTARGTGVDYRRIPALNFAPVLWCAMRIFMKMNSMFDFVRGVEPLLELLLIIMLLVFFALFIAESEEESGVSGFFLAIACITASLAFTVSVPRLLAMVLAGYKSLYTVDFSACTYLALGIFVVSVLADNAKRERNTISGE